MRRVYSPAAVRKLVKARGLSLAEWMDRVLQVDPTAPFGTTDLERYIDCSLAWPKMAVTTVATLALSLGVGLEDLLEFDLSCPGRLETLSGGVDPAWQAMADLLSRRRETQDLIDDSLAAAYRAARLRGPWSRARGTRSGDAAEAAGWPKRKPAPKRRRKQSG